MRRIAVTVTFAVLATVVVAALGGGPVAAAACTKTWAGAGAGTDGVWDQIGVIDTTETQWTPTGVPSFGDVVCLPAGDYQVTLQTGDSAAYTIAELHIGTSPSGVQPTFRIINEEALTVTGTITQPGGMVSLSGNLTGATYALTGGSLLGNGNLTTDLTNSGGVFGAANVGPNGASADSFLALNGTYTQTAGGTLHLDLDGDTNSVNQSHVHAAESVTLAGTLDIDMTDVPSPPAQVMIANLGISGSFSEVVGGPPTWVGILPLGLPPIEQMVIAPSPSFNDVGLTHMFFPDIEWLASVDVTGGFPDGGYHPSSPVTRQSMAAFLYRLVGEPPFTPPVTPSFNDVGTGHPFYKEIEWLADTEITGGFPDGGYHPTAAVTRQSMAAFLYRLAGEPAFTPPGTPTFPDVPTTSAFYLEVEWLVANDITGGFADGGYHPGAAVSRQSMAAFLHRFVSQGVPFLSV